MMRCQAIPDYLSMAAPPMMMPHAMLLMFTPLLLSHVTFTYRFPAPAVTPLLQRYCPASARWK